MSLAVMLSVCTCTCDFLPAGMTGLVSLPRSVYELILRGCTLEGQRASAQTSIIFRELWGSLDIYTAGDEMHSPATLTARTLWQRQQSHSNALALARRFRAEMHEKPLGSSGHSIYHISLTGYLNQKELQLILSNGHPYINLLRLYFNMHIEHLFSPAEASFFALSSTDLGDTAVFMLTFKLLHSRQDGFSNKSLEKFGDFFACLPDAYARWVLGGAYNARSLFVRHHGSLYHQQGRC